MTQFILEIKDFFSNNLYILIRNMLNFINQKNSIYLTNKKGFSLIELLVVIALMGIITALATIGYVGGQKDIDLKKSEVSLEGFLNEMRLKAFTDARPYKIYLENISTNNISIKVYEPTGTEWYDFDLTKTCNCQVGSDNSPSVNCNNTFTTTIVAATPMKTKTIEKVKIHKCDNADCSSSTEDTINICFLPDGTSPREQTFKMINLIEGGDDKVKTIYQTGYVD